MKQRTNKKYEEGVGFEIMSMLTAYGFETKEKAYPTINFFEGYEGRLFARINVYGDHASVSFGGTGIKKDRTMEYYIEDLGKNRKFENRLKRIIREARAVADRHARRNERNVTTFDKTNQLLKLKGIADAVQSDYGSDAIFFINGYQLQCKEDLLISVNVGGNRIKLDVLAAVTLMKSIPFNPEPEED